MWKLVIGEHFNCHYYAGRSVLLVDFTVPESFIGRIVTNLEVQARQ